MAMHPPMRSIFRGVPLLSNCHPPPAGWRQTLAVLANEDCSRTLVVCPWSLMNVNACISSSVLSQILPRVPLGSRICQALFCKPVALLGDSFAGLRFTQLDPQLQWFPVIHHTVRISKQAVHPSDKETVIVATDTTGGRKKCGITDFE